MGVLYVTILHECKIIISLDIIISFDTMRSVKPDLMFDKKNAIKSLNELACQILIQMKIMLHFYRCENGSVYS